MRKYKYLCLLIMIVTLSFCGSKKTIEKDFLSTVNLKGSNSKWQNFKLLKDKTSKAQLKLVNDNFISYYKGSLEYYNDKLIFVPLKETVSFFICKNKKYDQSKIGYLVTDTTNFKNLDGLKLLYEYNFDNSEKDTSIILKEQETFFKINSLNNKVKVSLINESFLFLRDTFNININTTAVCLNSKKYFDTLSIEIKNDSIILLGNRNLKLTTYFKLESLTNSSSF